jgi:hypothetical protein
LTGDALHRKSRSLTISQPQGLGPIDPPSDPIGVVDLDDIRLDQDLPFFPVQARDLNGNPVLLLRRGANYQGIAAAFDENRVLGVFGKSTLDKGASNGNPGS